MQEVQSNHLKEELVNQSFKKEKALLFSRESSVEDLSYAAKDTAQGTGSVPDNSVMILVLPIIPGSVVFLILNWVISSGHTKIINTFTKS